MGMGNNEDLRLTKFRSALFGLVQGAVEAGDVSEEGAGGLYIGSLVAARETLLDQDPEDALADEIARWASPPTQTSD